MTAVAVPRPVVARQTLDTAAVLRRVQKVWSEPEPWTVALVLATGLVVIARHPIAQALGTEDAPTAASAAVSSLTSGVAVGALPRIAELPTMPLAPAPEHAPRDPFQPAPAAAAPPASAPVAGGSDAVAPTTAQPRTATCFDRHVVRQGESLWSIAASASKSGTVSWRRIYTLNRRVVGPDPSMLQIGQRLCLPR